MRNQIALGDGTLVVPKSNHETATAIIIQGQWNTESIRGETLIDQIEASIDLPLWVLQV